MRSRVRAIIIDGGNIILHKRIIGDLAYYIFPGGKVEDGENMEDALKRECKEELGLSVKPKNLLMQKRFDRPEIEQMEYFYVCDIVGGVLGTGNGQEYLKENCPYEGFHEVELVDLRALKDIDLRPEEVKEAVLKIFVKFSHRAIC